MPPWRILLYLKPCGGIRKSVGLKDRFSSWSVDFSHLSVYHCRNRGGTIWMEKVWNKKKTTIRMVSTRRKRRWSQRSVVIATGVSGRRVFAGVGHRIAKFGVKGSRDVVNLWLNSSSSVSRSVSASVNDFKSSFSIVSNFVNSPPCELAPLGLLSSIGCAKKTWNLLDSKI